MAAEVCALPGQIEEETGFDHLVAYGEAAGMNGRGGAGVVGAAGRGLAHRCPRKHLEETAGSSTRSMSLLERCNEENDGFDYHSNWLITVRIRRVCFDNETQRQE